jgi:Zinc carboxypeptidase
VRQLTGFIVVLAVLVTFPAFLKAEMTGGPEDFLVDGYTYNPDIPLPEEFLGHRIGDSPVRHHMLVEYITSIAENSDRMSVEVIGYTHERRPILFVTVTSPENHARIDEILAAQKARTEPGSGDVASDMPVVTWLNYGVHGVEESGMDASLPLIYHLAAAEGEAIENQLKNSVILVTAIFNPDGHSRRAAWRDQRWSYNRNTDDQDWVKNFDFPSPRTNHYWFDLNRQWLLLTQPEPRAWMSKWHQWRPNLTVDYHEMGRFSTYYFHPGDPTRYFPRIPQEARDLTVEYARYSSDWLDSEGLLFYNEEGYDNFYIGKGSTFPLINGGVGILYEASQGMGGEVVTSNGYSHSYRENVRKHFRTSVTSIEAATAMRASLQNYQAAFYSSALDEARGDATKAYVFAAPEDNQRVQHFIDILTFHRIAVNELARNVSVDGMDFTAGEAYVVQLNQPQYRLARAIFDRVTEFENETFYDVSTWTMPLAFNLMNAELRGRAFNAGLVGGELDGPQWPQAPAVDEASYGYMFDWSPYYAPKALNQVLDSGALARVLTRPATVETTKGPRAFDRGAIFVHFEHQDLSRAELHALMSEVAEETGVTVHAVTSGWTPEGPQLGSGGVRHIAVPKPLIVVGSGVSSYDAGEIWHLLDYRMKMAVSMMPKDELGSRDLSRYTHIIFPGGNYSSLDDDVVEKLNGWVSRGGTIIAESRASVWAQNAFLGNDEEDDADDDDSDDVERANYADKPDMEAQQVIGGAIFGSDLDITHPMGFGYVRRNIATQKSGTHTLQRPDNPWAVVAEYLADEPRLSGFAAAENREDIAGTPMLIAERKGDGSVILFADNPNFRAAWYGTNKLFLNAIFFSTAFDSPRRNFEEADGNEVD